MDSAFRGFYFFPVFLSIVPLVYLSVGLSAHPVLVRLRKSPLMRASLLLVSFLLLSVVFLAVSFDSSFICWDRAFLWGAARSSTVEAGVVSCSEGTFSLFG